MHRSYTRLVFRLSLVSLLTIGPLTLPLQAIGGTPSPTSEASEPSSEEGQFSRQILWTETWDGQLQAIFVPEEVLRETPIENLPISDADRHTLRRQLHEYDEFRKKVLELKGIEVPKCSPWRAPHVLPHEPTTLARKIVEHSTFAFTGEVVDVVTGWYTGRVAQAVYVRVDSVVYDPEDHLLEGDVFAFLQLAGEMRIGDRKLCTQPNPEQYLARDRHEILLAGDPHADDERLIHASIVLPLRDGVIQPVPTVTLLPMEPLPLHVLQTQVATLREEVQ